MLFSIIVPTANRLDRLNQFLTSLTGCEYARHDFEVIVIENGSEPACRDHCTEKGEGLNVKYLFSPLPGFSAASARNIGIKNAEGEYIFFFDDDVIPLPNCIEEHLEIHRGAAAPKMVIGLRHNLIRDDKIAHRIGVFETDYRAPLFSRQQFAKHPWYLAYSCNMSVPRIATKHMLFDEDFQDWGHEDQEYAYRFYSAGGEIAVAMKSIVMHHTDAAVRNPFLRERYGLSVDYVDYLRSRIHFVRKFWDVPEIRDFLINDLRHFKKLGAVWRRTALPNENFSIEEMFRDLKK
jgi:glycosyltransferase involved in cell wall biosynthesis